MKKCNKRAFSLALAMLTASCMITVGTGQNVRASAEAFSMTDILVPFWEGETSYMESVLPVAQKDGTVAPIHLLYPIEEIIEVKNASLNVTYQADVDYAVQDGKLVLLEGTKIPVLSYDDFHPQAGSSNAVDGFEDRNGGYVLWKEGSWFHSRQIVVTYKHAAGYSGYIPEGKGRLLPTIQEKLKDGELNVLVYGDSISTGANSSGHEAIHVAPNMPIYPLLFAEGLKQTYGVETVNVYNASVGGTDSAWGLSNLRGGVLNKYEDIDLAILAFGMNDTARDPESFASNMQRMARGLTSKYKDVEVMIVATMLPNYEAYKFYGQQAHFYDALMAYEKEGVAIVNMTATHAGLLDYKAYADMTGNNINHANDYLARVYAQTLLKTLEISDYGAEEPEPPENSETPEAPETSDSLSSENSGNEEVPETNVSSSEEGSSKKSGGCGSVMGIGACGMTVLGAAALVAEQRKRK